MSLSRISRARASSLAVGRAIVANGAPVIDHPKRTPQEIPLIPFSSVLPTAIASIRMLARLANTFAYFGSSGLTSMPLSNGNTSCTPSNIAFSPINRLPPSELVPATAPASKARNLASLDPLPVYLISFIARTPGTIIDVPSINSALPMLSPGFTLAIFSCALPVRSKSFAPKIEAA